MNNFEPSLNGGRLTLTTLVPVTTADVSAATTIYFTPYKHAQIALWNGTNWLPYNFSQVSLSLSGYTASKPYDIFGYVSAGGIFAVESLIWTNTTTRATALVMQNGVLCKTGDLTRRYLGTVYINATGGQTDDSVAKRYVFNYENRVNKKLLRVDPTGAWAYDTASYAQISAVAANQVEIMAGWADFELTLTHCAYASFTTGGAPYCGIGIDSDTVNSSDIRTVGAATTGPAYPTNVAVLSTFPAVGYHRYSMLAIGAGGTGMTFVGTSGEQKNGMNGAFLC